MKNSRLKTVVHSKPDSQEAKALMTGLTRYNKRYGGKKDWRELTIAMKDAKGKVIAGLTGYTCWGWLFIKLLWVSDHYRGSGLGRELMARAEKEAKKRKCRNAWLDTFAFQAPGFYRKLGYRKFGELGNFPTGYKRLFYAKSF
jgi:ribosomal protein S18 acetylase RimI-like enzyme